LAGASVAEVAVSHRLNASIEHGWRKLTRQAQAVGVSEQFVPVAVAPVVPRAADERTIETELRRGGTNVKLSWPVSAAMDLSG
jgi:transposase